MRNDAVTVISREQNPFADDDIVVDADGVRHFRELPESLVAVLRGNAAENPDVEALVEIGGERLTYAQLWDRATRVAGGLKARGLQRGDRVAVRYPAGVNWVVAFWGVVLAGGIVVAVNTRSTAPEVEFVLSDSGTTIDLEPGGGLPAGEPYVEEGIGLDDVAALFYTSGTTGNPKGVPTTHEAFLSNIANCTLCFAVPRDLAPAEFRTLISVPLFHVTGCNSQLLLAAAYAGTAVILPAFDQDLLIDALQNERINFLVTVPAIYALVLRHPRFAAVDTSSIGWVTYGGAPIAPTLVRALQEAFPNARVANGYGMTETCSVMTALPHEDGVEHADSVGYAAPSVELAVAPQDPAEPRVGELLTRGANVATEYWNRPDATASTMIDGWLHTGDVVRVDEDGRVHIIDRMKDIINRGGENVSSIEVEAALLAHPEIVEAAVLAVPDEVMGEKVGAILYGGENEVVVEDVLATARALISDFKVPQYIVVAEEPLPRNPGGKLLKGVLRKGVEWGAPLR